MKIKFILILFFLTSIGLSEQSSEEIQNEISDYTVILERAKLRGIQEEMDVYKVLVENVQPSMSI